MDWLRIWKIPIRGSRQGRDPCGKKSGIMLKVLFRKRLPWREKAVATI